MDRRTFLKAGAGVAAVGSAGGLSSPALSQGAAARTLRFVPQANLANFDPIWGTQYVVRNAAFLVNSASFLASAIIIARTSFNADPPEVKRPAGWSSLTGLGDLLEGIRYVRSDRHVAALMPRQLVYASFLTEAAQQALGTEHPELRWVRQALEGAGWRWRHQVRVDDGGPVLQP